MQSSQQMARGRSLRKRSPSSLTRPGQYRYAPLYCSDTAGYSYPWPHRCLVLCTAIQKYKSQTPLTPSHSNIGTTIITTQSLLTTINVLTFLAAMGVFHPICHSLLRFLLSNFYGGRGLYSR